MEYKQKSLFDKKPEPVKTGYESIHQPEHDTDRYVLINHDTKERFACKFYNIETDKFISSSCLDMYTLNDHFDRSVIDMEKQAHEADKWRA